MQGLDEPPDGLTEFRGVLPPCATVSRGGTVAERDLAHRPKGDPDVRGSSARDHP